MHKHEYRIYFGGRGSFEGTLLPQTNVDRRQTDSSSFHNGVDDDETVSLKVGYDENRVRFKPRLLTFSSVHSVPHIDVPSSF